MKKRDSHAKIEGVVVPAFSDLNRILEFGRELQNKDQVVLDFSEVGFARPTGMLLLSSIIAEAVDEEKIVANIGATANDYAANMGFYEACKIDVPKGNAPGGATYYPITIHSVVEAQEAAAEKGVPIGEHVNFMVGRLAYLITREARGNLGVSETLCMRLSPRGFDGSSVEPFWV